MQALVLVAAAVLGALVVFALGRHAEIPDWAQTRDALLIAMTTHGYSRAARWDLGGVADKMIRLASIPVLAPRAPEYEEGASASCNPSFSPLNGRWRIPGA